MRGKLEESDAELVRSVHAELAARRAADRGGCLQKAFTLWFAVSAINATIGLFIPMPILLFLAIEAFFGLFAASIGLALQRGMIGERIAEIEAGTRCLRCEARAATRRGHTVSCSVCGFTTSATNVQFCSDTERAAEPIALREWDEAMKE